jgi:acyl carrier protein
METEILKIIANRCDCSLEEVTSEKHIIDDLNADSLSVVEIIMDLEAEFDIQITDEEAEELLTVKQIKEYIEVNT